MPDAIFVLGMGRSGTSAVTRVLSFCGAALPRRMIRANEWNERGYYESLDAVEINDAFLSEHASSWWDPRPDAHDVSLDCPRAQRFVRRIASMIKDQYPNDGTIVLKDPRISGLFPFWRAALRGLGYTVKAVIVARHPDEVADSMRVRDCARRELSNLMWLKYNLLSLRDTLDIPHHIVVYEDLLADWSAVARGCIARLDLDLAITDEARENVAGFLSPALRHQQRSTTPLDGKTSGLLADTFAVMMTGDVSSEITTSLVSRFRALPEIASPIPERESFAALPITSRITGFTDEIISGAGQSVSLDRCLVIGPEFSFDLRGWALRADGYISVDKIVVTQDGLPVAAAVSDHRVDISEIYGSQAGLSGFRARVSGRATEGPHFFEVFAIAGGQRTSIGKIEARVVLPRQLVATPLLRITSIAHDLAVSDGCHFEGWGLDPQTETTFAGAALLVDDDLIVPCVYGMGRPDVQKIFGAAGDEFGFTSFVDSAMTSPGRHRVRAMGVPSRFEGSVWISDRAAEFETPH